MSVGRLVHPRRRRDTVRVDGVTEANILIALRHGQTITVDAGANAVMEITRFESGAVQLRNANTRKVFRAWAPKEANHAN